MSLIKEKGKDKLNALDRLLATVSGETPDRIPLFPMIDSIPSRLVNMNVESYYSDAENVINGQKKLQKLLNLDYVSNFYYLPIETELFGMKTLFFQESSPNSGNPIVKSLEFFAENKIPNIYDNEDYIKTIKTTKGLAELYKGKIPILSVQSGPFSFPSLLMGTTEWFEFMLMEPENISYALEFSRSFCNTWAKGHIEAGADVIVLVDGLATATSIPRDVFIDYVIPLYKQLKNDISAPIVFYTAGGDILPFADLFDKMGVLGVFPSSNDDLTEVRQKSEGEYSLFGNINNLEFGDWSLDFMDNVISNMINENKEGGKYILSTQHMIPHNVSIQKIADMLNIALKHAYY
ncbi:MAG: hypothetical protein GF383_02985 [Candidatus Lokiarchaeota archaeon]|nr:hypothetical protein [Candidatus Lokiarchaeota archaeon]MBD3338497.1 hypothetical protein [Candidatus Lokiarchaeota archaeon]